MADRIPPDIMQCQAEKPNGNTFMTLGGIPGYVRCKNTPVFIAVAKAVENDGHIGSMSVCAECRKILEKQMLGYAIFTIIEPKD